MNRLKAVSFYSFFGIIIIAIWFVINGFHSLIIESSGTDSEMFMFYNCENLFDIKNDTLKNDEEFLPGGTRGWNSSKYFRKISSIAKVILSVGNWDPPALVGLCEVENEIVIADMLKSTPLNGHGYSMVYSNSSDSRGIDVCLLYRKSVATVLFSGSYNPVTWQNDSIFTGRPILYSKLEISGQIIHVMINHWPSRRGGVLNGQPVRRALAEKIAELSDSIKAADGYSATILVAGDFNCNPDDSEMEILEREGFINLARSEADSGKGTYRYRGVWYMFDQILVTASSTNINMPISISNFSVHKPEMLLMEDEAWPGLKPFPTYNNYNYAGGFSDHLPVRVNIFFNRDPFLLWRLNP